MPIIIQLIETSWTKRSRGNPGASIRNRVPELVEFLETPKSDPILLLVVKFTERNNFSTVTKVSIDNFTDQDAERWNIRIVQPHESPVEIAFFGGPSSEQTGKPVDVVHLQRDTWVQIMSNRRISEEWDWTYKKYVYNIVHCGALTANAVVRSMTPIRKISHEKLLW
jgi:hypothetical protein